MVKISRRRFIKNSIAAGAGLSVFPMAVPSFSSQPIKASRKIVVHPDVDNLRVVGITDESMIRDHEPVSSWKKQEQLVVKDAIWENIDKLACGLTEMGDPLKAWQTIFIKPPRKSWSETIVAIKTNNISKQHTRSPVIGKICYTFTDILGVKPENIHIYDACHGRNISRDTPFSGLPDGCRIQNQWGGSNTYTSIPGPWKEGKEKSKCLKHLVDGSVDILVNISMCKGHSDKFGGFTMTMKNHFGTFSPRPGHFSGSQDYLMAINKTPEVLGTMDKKTGNILFPRQQLCLVDALWASEDGPGGNPSAQPNFLAMGALSPVLDYQVATKFRKGRMGWDINLDAAQRMLAEFGYSEKDLPGDGGILYV